MNTLITALAQARNFYSLSTPTAPPLGRRCRSWWVSTGSIRSVPWLQVWSWNHRTSKWRCSLADTCWKAASCTWAFHIVSVLCLLLFLPYIPSFQESDSLATSIHTILVLSKCCFWFRNGNVSTPASLRKPNHAVPPNLGLPRITQLQGGQDLWRSSGK